MRNWVEISKDNLNHNLQVIRQTVGDNVLIAPCIKANAYGHGMLELALELDKNDSEANWLCVQSVEEARILRQNFIKPIKKPILLISAFLPDEVEELVSLKIKTFVFETELIKLLNQEAQRQGKVVDIHLLVNTGMGWLGILPYEAQEYSTLIKQCTNLNFEGLTTHFATSDDYESTFFEQQLKTFEDVWQELGQHNLQPKMRHCANSGAFLRTAKAHFDLIQPGISLYGMYPSEQSKEDFEKHTNKSLKPLLSLKSRIAGIKKLPVGHGVGYGNTFITTTKRLVATLPIGYWDGLDRRMSNNGLVEVKGQLCPIVGRIGMNSAMVDITELDFEVAFGQEVTIVSSNPDSQISATKIAERISTINYEVTTRINPLLGRLWV